MIVSHSLWAGELDGRWRLSANISVTVDSSGSEDWAPNTAWPFVPASKAAEFRFRSDAKNQVFLTITFAEGRSSPELRCYISTVDGQEGVKFILLRDAKTDENYGLSALVYVDSGTLVLQMPKGAKDYGTVVVLKRIL